MCMFVYFDSPVSMPSKYSKRNRRRFQVLQRYLQNLVSFAHTLCLQFLLSTWTVSKLLSSLVHRGWNTPSLGAGFGMFGIMFGDSLNLYFKLWTMNITLQHLNRSTLWLLCRGPELMTSCRRGAKVPKKCRRFQASPDVNQNESTWLLTSWRCLKSADISCVPHVKLSLAKDEILDCPWGHAILTFWCCMLRWLSEASWNWWDNQHIVMLSLQCRSQGLPLLGSWF